MRQDDIEWMESRGPRDAKENRETEPPPDELVQVTSIQCFELYTSSHMERLTDGVRRLGWVHDRKYDPPFVNLEEWFRTARSLPFQNAWANVAWVAKSGDSPPSHNLHAPLPEGVDSMWATFRQATPGVTALAAHFVLDDEETLALDRALREPQESSIERTDRGWAYPSPRNKKHDLVKAERARLRRLCHDWLAEYVPGLFSDPSSTIGMPTIEVLTCAASKPFHEAEDRSSLDYRWLLGTSSDSDAFESDNLPDWRLAAWEYDVPASVLRLGARTSDVEAAEDSDLGSSGGRSSLAHRLDYLTSDFGTRFALHCLLSTYEKHLSEARDKAAALSDADVRVSHRAVADAHRLLTRAGYDTRVVAPEIADLCHDRNAWRILDFQRVPDYYQDRPTFWAVLRSSMSDRSVNLLGVETTVRESVATSASLIGTRVSLRLDRRVLVATIAAVAISVASLLIASFDIFSSSTGQSDPTESGLGRTAGQQQELPVTDSDVAL